MAIEDADGNLQILARGYHPQLGGLLVTAGTTPPQVDVDEAVPALSDLLSEFDFQTPSDRSRALAAFIAPALALGDFIKGRVPADVAEANESQAGTALHAIGFQTGLAFGVFGNTALFLPPDISEALGRRRIDFLTTRWPNGGAPESLIPGLPDAGASTPDQVSDGEVPDEA